MLPKWIFSMLGKMVDFFNLGGKGDKCEIVMVLIKFVVPDLLQKFEKTL